MTLEYKIQDLKVKNWDKCCYPGCRKPATLTFKGKPLCDDHFDQIGDD